MNKTGERREWAGGCGGGDGDAAKMNIGDYRPTGNAGRIFDSAFCDCFFI